MIKDIYGYNIKYLPVCFFLFKNYIETYTCTISASQIKQICRLSLSPTTVTIDPIIEYLEKDIFINYFGIIKNELINTVIILNKINIILY